MACQSATCSISIPVFDEIQDVLRRPKFGLSAEQVLGFVQEIQGLCQLVEPRETLHVVAADPDDNRILECAAAAQATVIVSGDAHVHDLVTWNGIRILSPAEFVRELEIR